MRRPPTARHLAVLVPAALSMLAVACGSSGREMREPNREAVSPTRSTVAPTSSTFAPTTLQLVAEGFAPGGALPAANGCGGKAPALTWTGIPDGTAEVAVGLVDFDETDTTKRVNWLVSGLPGGTTEGTLPAGGAPPAGAVTLSNGKGSAAYDGPCITGGKGHTVNYMVFALPAPSGLTPDVPAADAFAQLEAAAQGNIAYYTATAPSS